MKTPHTTETAKITRLTRLDGQPAGKTFILKRGEVEAIVSGHAGRYSAQTLTFTGTPDEIAAQFAGVLTNLTHCQAILLGHVPAMGDAEYQILPQRELKERGLDPEGIHFVDGTPMLARLKHHFTPSRLLLLDYDPDPAMPDEVLALDEAGRWALLCQVFPEFEGATRIVMPSSSSRARMADGSPIGKGKKRGEHTYVLLDHAPTVAELDAMRDAAQIRLWAAGLGFIKTSKSGAELRRTLIDISVWTAGREVFAGPPTVRRKGLTVVPATLTLHEGGTAALIAAATSEQIALFSQATGCQVHLGLQADETEGTPRAPTVLPGLPNQPIRPLRPRLVFENSSTMRLHTSIKTEKGTMTVAQFLNSGHTRLRCQATFRASTSWAGILKKTPLGCKLFDVGTSTRYVLCTEYEEISGTLPDALAELGKQDAANAQGYARALYYRHRWRCPVKLGYEALHQQICDAHPAVDAKDLMTLIEIDQAHTRAAAIKPVRLDPRALPSGVVYREARSPEEITAHIQQHGGVHLVKAPHGSGKTQHILRPLSLGDAVQRTLRSTVAIAPRKSLVHDSAHRLELADYLEAIAGEVHLAVCLNSIAKPKFAEAMQEAKVVLVDEISRCIDEVHNPAGTLRDRGQGKLVWDTFIDTLNRAEIMVGVDADLNNEDVRQIAENTPKKVTVWHIPEQTRDLSATFVSDSEALDQLDHAVTNGERVLFFADSAEKVAGQAARLQAAHPDKHIVAIHQKKGCATAGNPEIVSLLGNFDAGVDTIDVLLLSPTVESGISLNVEHFTKHIAIYGGTVQPSQFNQALLRDRTARTWTIGISGHGFRHETISRADIINGLSAASRRVSELSDGCITAIPATPFDECCVERLIAANSTRNHYANHLWFLLEHRGWTLNCGPTDNNPNGRALHREAKQRLADQQCQAVLAANDVDAHTASQYRESHRLTTEQSAELARFDVRDATGHKHQPVNALDVRVWRDGKLEMEVQRMEDAVMTPAPSERDQSEADAGIPLVARHYDGARRESMGVLFDALGINPITGEGEITADSAMAAWQSLKGTPQGDILDTYGIARLNQPPQSPVRWASDALAKFGLWIEGTGHHDRTYRLAMEMKLTKQGEIKLPGFLYVQACIARRGRVARSRMSNLSTMAAATGQRRAA